MTNKFKKKTITLKFIFAILIVIAIVTISLKGTLMNIEKKDNNFDKKVKEQIVVSNFINKERMKDSFIKMAKIDTGSCEKKKTSNAPSTQSQIKFAKILLKELKQMGLSEVSIDENGILTATMEGNIKNGPIIGLIAHIDTSEQTPTGPVNPQIHNYKTGDIQLKNGVKISAKDLEPYKNSTIITSDGTTLLGADDKAGIAEILEALRVLKEHPEIKRPTLKIAFTPDEEIGAGVQNFDIKKFGADVAYTVDGSEPDFVETETFNAFNPEITIQGVSIHPGYAYGKMVNSIEVANALINKLPRNEFPENTKKKEGYYHVEAITGTSDKITIKMLVRDFDYKSAEKRIDFLNKMIIATEKEYSGCKITFNPNEKYRNMKEKLNEFPEVIEFAKKGLQRSGFNASEASIRGGTDGALLTLKGLLTPNLGTGGINFHSPNEFVSLETMVKCCENVLNIVNVWAEKSDEIMPKILERRNKQ